jgi:hypothetical protein
MVQGVGKTVIELLFPTFPLKSSKSRFAERKSETLIHREVEAQLTSELPLG